MVGTANFTNPLACPQIIGEIKEFMRKQGIRNLGEIRGCIVVKKTDRIIVALDLQTQDRLLVASG